MENYLSRHAAVNVFTETELHSMQRGLVAKWAPRPANAGIYNEPSASQHVKRPVALV